MREYKFRGQRIDPENNPGKWEYGSLIAVAPPDDIPYFSKLTYPLIWNENGVYSVDPKTIGEYTGLKDKNDKEIYEGDILEDDGDWYTVAWDEMDAQFQGIDHVHGINIGLGQLAAESFIQGNIHQHPELLTPKQ